MDEGDQNGPPPGSHYPLFTMNVAGGTVSGITSGVGAGRRNRPHPTPHHPRPRGGRGGDRRSGIIVGATLVVALV